MSDTKDDDNTLRSTHGDPVHHPSHIAIVVADHAPFVRADS